MLELCQPAVGTWSATGLGDDALEQPLSVDTAAARPYLSGFATIPLEIAMPKIRTHKASAKRIRKRGSGSLKRRNAYATHILGKRSTKRKRGFRKNEPISPADQNLVRRALNLK